MKKEYRIVLVGPPGSGKGTQAEILSQQLNIPIIGTGELFRKEIKKNTPLGKKIAKALRSGHLISNPITNTMVNATLSKIGFQKSFIFDGYPRNINQARNLNQKTQLTHVFVISLSDREVIRRISMRRVCKHGHTYHLEFKPPQKKGICDICSTELSIRSDSSPEIVKKRLEIYKKQTRPILDYFKKYGPNPIVIKGGGSISVVAEMIKKYI